MKTEQIVMCVVALALGMLVANMLTNVCGCKTTEGLLNMPSTGSPWKVVTTGMSGNCKSNDINICDLAPGGNLSINDLPPSCNTMDKTLLNQFASSIPDIPACSTPQCGDAKIYVGPADGRWKGGLNDFRNVTDACLKMDSTSCQEADPCLSNTGPDSDCNNHFFSLKSDDGDLTYIKCSNKNDSSGCTTYNSNEDDHSCKGSETETV